MSILVTLLDSTLLAFQASTQSFLCIFPVLPGILFYVHVQLTTLWETVVDIKSKNYQKVYIYLHLGQEGITMTLKSVLLIWILI